MNNLHPSTGHSSLKTPMLSAKAAMDASGVGHPKIVFSDKCCDDEPFLLKIFPTISSEIKKSVSPMLGPPFEWPLTVRPGSRGDYAKPNKFVMSLDCEWDTSSNSKVGKVPVILLAMRQPRPFAAFINLDTSKAMPLELKMLLEHPNITKVGSHIFHDARHLLNDYGVKLKEEDCVRLEKLCKKNKWTASAHVGMKKMAEKVLGVIMKKDENIQSGIWNKKTHTREEIAYGINDAYFGLMIYETAKFQCPNTEFRDAYAALTTIDSTTTSPTNSTSETSPSSSSPVLPFKVTKHVILDAFHTMQRIQKLTPSPKKHPAASGLMKAFRDAMFIINEEDRIKIEAVLKEHFNGMTLRNSMNHAHKQHHHDLRRHPVKLQE
ncbi:UNVERIFIED_CONTAM: hypothetical protein HDU68_002647 [Siphonaria sp. JEL0065]|nr:hypothetical protein HDU68_002647 [Siphonaria sp. JEL0065]